MTQSLLLPWFPILLAVGVGGRLLGKTRGFALGLLCALFWIALVQSTHGLAVWRDPWTVMTLLVGSFAVCMMGGWSGQSEPLGAAAADAQAELLADPAISEGRFRRFGEVMKQFQDWIENRRSDVDPWPEFGEFLRSALYHCCEATHVKPYRLVQDDQQLLLLRTADPFCETECVPVRRGILGHVVTTGRSYLAGDPQQGKLVAALAEQGAPPVPWCFAVTHGPRRLGAISVGHLNLDPRQNRNLLETAERLISNFWLHLLDSTRSRTAGEDDPVSQVLNRQAFFRASKQTLRECYDQGEPVAMAVIAVSGLRKLNDSGRWEIADEIVRDIGAWLRRKVRMDDRIGRFDGSRFVWLLRRVDSELARLIVSQVMGRLCGASKDDRWGSAGHPIEIHCGLTGAGIERPDLRNLIARALTQSHRARIEKIPIASDLDSEPAPRPAAREAEVAR